MNLKLYRIKKFYMPDNIHHHHHHHKTKPFWRRALAWLGIRHITRKMVAIYVLVFFVLVFLAPFIYKFIKAFAEFLVVKEKVP